MKVDFEQALQLWQEWQLARKAERLAPVNKETNVCLCEQPSLYWDESPSKPGEYETEYCHRCGDYSNWNRTTIRENAFGWIHEHNIVTGENRYRSEIENLLLTESEYTDRMKSARGEIKDDKVHDMCRNIAHDNDTPAATLLIKRRFLYTPAISKSQPNSHGQCMVSGMIFSRTGATISF
jgi:hypothetical protein